VSRHGFAFGVSNQVETAVKGFFGVIKLQVTVALGGWQNALKVLIHGIEASLKARCRR